MTEPLHHVSDALDAQPFGQLRPRDHDDRQAEQAGRIDLGTRAVAAGIAGDDPGDAARAHHLQLAVERERPARHDHVGDEGQGHFRRIDEPQRVGMLRPRRERRDVLAADGEEHVGRRFGQRGDCCVDIANLNPDVAGRLAPGRALQRDQRRAGLRARFDRVTAHLGGKGMRRVDDMRDTFATNIVGKPAHAAKAADAGRQWLIGWRSRSATIGIHRINPCARDLGGEQARIGNSAQNKGARHV